MRAMRVAPLIGLLIVGLIFTIVAVLVPQAMYAADYAASGNGSVTNSTNTTATVSGAESMWFWGLGLLVFILVIGLIFWKFFVR